MRLLPHITYSLTESPIGLWGSEAFKALWRFQWIWWKNLYVFTYGVLKNTWIIDKSYMTRKNNIYHGPTSLQENYDNPINML